jgi:carbon starvation protein
MSIAIICLASISFLLVGYFFYSRIVAHTFGVNDNNLTPACKINDGMDYVPTKPFYLLGQHFSAIAAAGPIVGPILACLNFGWLPVVLWIVLGAIFIGAVHDFSALFSSIRHNASTIAEITRFNLGKKAYILFLLFIWISLIYVITAFTDVTANTFLGKVEELEGTKVAFNAGGAVAFASSMYLLLAIVMGIVQKTLNPPLWLSTPIFVPMILFVVWLGTKFSTLLLLDIKVWYVLILIYCFIASILPVWLLLQPRGYLGGFVLYLAFFVGIIGIFFGGYTVKQDYFKFTGSYKLGEFIFPFLFVTVACGACSGFHGLVCSGTTSKQLAKESHARPIGYGGMLLESLVAIIALATVMIFSSSEIKGQSAGRIYGNGLAHYLTILIGKENLVFAVTFGAMAFSTFVFDTIDVATRLGRYILQELFGYKNFFTAIVSTALTVIIPLIFLLIGSGDSWKLYWLLFGTANQLMGGLTLLVVSVWLYKTGKKMWFTLLPSFFLLCITIFSLLLHIYNGFKLIKKTGLTLSADMVNAFIAFILIVIVMNLLKESIKNFIAKTQ